MSASSSRALPTLYNWLTLLFGDELVAGVVFGFLCCAAERLWAGLLRALLRPCMYGIFTGAGCPPSLGPVSCAACALLPVSLSGFGLFC